MWVIVVVFRLLKTYLRARLSRAGRTSKISTEQIFFSPLISGGWSHFVCRGITDPRAPICIKLLTNPQITAHPISMSTQQDIGRGRVGPRCSRAVIRRLWRCSKPAWAVYFVIAWHFRERLSASRIADLVRQEFGSRPSVTRVIEALCELSELGVIVTHWEWRGRRRELAHVEVMG